MIRRFSLFISWGCTVALLVAPMAALYLLFDIATFADLARTSLQLPIQWHTVSAPQWYGLWFLSVIYLVVGLVGLYFLRRAFSNFAKGELFNPDNSQDLRMFAISLFAQALVKPLHSDGPR